MNRQSKRYSMLAVAGLAAALVVAVLGVLSGVLYRAQWLPLGDAFTLLRWAAYGSLAALAVSVAGVVHARPGGPRRGMSAAVAGIIIAAGVFWVPYSQQRLARELPPIHDITTDTENPPEFRAVLPLRPGDANSLAYGGEALARRQQTAYPHIRPAVFDASIDKVFDAALATADEMGWRIVDSARETGRIEAVSTTFWFGFRDDVVVRVSKHGGGARVDVRSVSRIGRSDVGKNAARISRFMGALEARL